MHTIADHKARTLLRPLNLRDVDVAAVVAGRTAYTAKLHKLGQDALASPEREALWFYLTHHAVSALVAKYDEVEPLTPDTVKWLDDYHDRLQMSSLRMFYYLLQICVREARHAQPGSKLSAVYAKHSQAGLWHQQYAKTNADKALNTLTYTPPGTLTMGQLAAFLSDVFHHASYSNGYGGKAWGNIADVLKQFVYGEISGEMMLDTAFTLAHNNGPIFNKSMWFVGYDLAALQEILDVQRAGMIPQYVHETASSLKANQYRGASYISEEMRQYVSQFAPLCADFTGPVRWNEFKALGAIGDYSKYIKYIKEGTGKAQSKVEQFKANLVAKKEAAHAAYLKSITFDIMPGLTATKITREAA